MPILNLVHVNLHVTDLERSIDFYGRLGWELMFDLGRRAPGETVSLDPGEGAAPASRKALAVVLSLGDDPRRTTKIELMQYVDPPATPKPKQADEEAGVHRLAMRVKDLDGTIAQLRERGIEIPGEPSEVKMMGGRQRYVLFHDPDGHLLELIELLRT